MRGIFVKYERANVGINIFGEEGSSGAIILTDFSLCRNVFYRGGVTNFFGSLPVVLANWSSFGFGMTISVKVHLGFFNK